MPNKQNRSSLIELLIVVDHSDYCGYRHSEPASSQYRRQPDFGLGSLRTRGKLK
jgi:hypothetical protein